MLTYIELFKGFQWSMWKLNTSLQMRSWSNFNLINPHKLILELLIAWSSLLWINKQLWIPLKEEKKKEKIKKVFE